MIIACPYCSARHRVSPGGIPSQGAVARCAKCGRAFGVSGRGRPAEGPAPSPAASPPAAPAGRHAAVRAPAPSPPGRDPSGPQRRIPPRGAASRASGAPLAPGTRATTHRSHKAGGRIRLERSASGERPLLVTHGFGLGESISPGDDGNEQGAPADAFVALSAADLEQIASDIVTALAAAHADLVAQARADQRWDAHLGPVIRDAWADFQACAGTQASDEIFRRVLNAILAAGKAAF